ncbi:MAG TPA: hypothetical protein VN461_14715 [Vicinamibacteria bacterium]|nr:hypothetical protein [Vicinamibacteria bacterium]
MRVTAAILLLVASATLTAALGALLVGSLTVGVSCLSLGLGLLALTAAYRACGSTLSRTPLRPFDYLAGVLFLVAALRQFGWICFRRGDTAYTLLPFNYGDLPLHWTYIEYFANGAPFWPENPIFTGQRLRYPFGVDLFTALFVTLRVSLPGLLEVMGLVASVLALVALLRWGRGFAVGAFLFSGGLAALGAGPGPEAGGPAELAWKNLFLALFVPQRGFLFALPAGLILLWSWRERLLRGSRGLPAWVEGAVWGALPLFHLHTFIFISVIFGLWSLGGGRGQPWRGPLLWALVPASWSVWEVTDHFAAASLVGWTPGWMMGAQNPLVFLAVNFVFFLPLVLWAAARAIRRGDRGHLLLLGPGLLLFAALFFVRVAPWAWDNTKMMVWCYLLVLPAVGELVIDALAPGPRSLMLLAVFLPGIASVVEASVGSGPPLEIFRVSEREAVCSALSPLPIRDRVATAPTFNHPVALCGHPLVAGYAGHLWSHGIAAEPVTARLGDLMMGRPGWEEAARAVGARYLFWGAREEREFPTSDRPWETARRPLARGSWGMLYDLGE